MSTADFSQLRSCAENGIVTNWKQLRSQISLKLDETTKSFYKKAINKDISEANSLIYIKKILLDCEEPPFTVQRACELLVKPNIYRSAQIFLFYFKKLFLGISISAFVKPQSELDPIQQQKPIEIDHPALMDKNKLGSQILDYS
ncbi:hypothetical protein MHBO_000686, partial [Bonamia ostreae]